jgi:ABC-type branched-subunit amino acid transport system substrate-binding protein
MSQQGFKYVFMATYLPAEKIHEPYVKWLASLPASQKPKTVAYVAQDAAATKGEIAGMKALTDAAGISTVLNETYGTTVVDFSAVAAKVAAVNADLVVQTGYNESFAFAKAFCQTGAKPAFLVISTTVITQATYPSQVGSACAEGVTFSHNWDASMKTPESQRYVSLWKAAYGGTIPDAINGLQWTGLQVITAAVTHEKSLDADKLRTYLLKTTFDTLGGKLAFAPNGLPISDAGVVVQWQNSQRVIIWPPQYAAGKPMVPRG